MKEELNDKSVKAQIKESTKILLENLNNIEGEVKRIIDALKKEGISQASIDLSFLSLLNYLDEQDKLLRSIAGIRKRIVPLGSTGKMKVQEKIKA
jgi:Mg2+ and Co2+ transporter CorA